MRQDTLWEAAHAPVVHASRGDRRSAGPAVDRATRGAGPGYIGFRTQSARRIAAANARRAGGDAARGATPADFRTTVAGTRCGHHHRGSAASARDRTRSVSDARDLSTRGANGCRTGARDQRSARRDGRRNPSGSNPFGSNPFGTDPADAASFRDRFGEIRHTSREIPGGSDCFRPAADTSVVAGSLAHRFSPCRAWSGSRRPER